MFRMNAPILGIRKTRPGARFVLFATCALALAACQTDGASPTASDAPKAEAASAKPDAAAAKPQAAKPAEPVAEEPMTHTRAARECWMKTEKASAREDLDKRADVVNKCIDDKLKAAGAPPPKT